MSVVITISYVKKFKKVQSFSVIGPPFFQEENTHYWIADKVCGDNPTSFYHKSASVVTGRLLFL